MSKWPSSPTLPRPAGRPRSRARGRPGPGATVLGIVLLVTPLAAQAKKVVILDFEGKKSQQAQDAVVQVLSAEHTVVPKNKLRAEATKLGVGTECNETNIIGVASIFGAEGVVCGTLSKGSLELTIYNGGDGKEIGKVKVPVGRHGLDLPARDQIKGVAGAFLGKSWNWDAVDSKGGASGDTQTGGTAGAVQPAAGSDTGQEVEHEKKWAQMTAADDREDPLARRAREQKAVTTVKAAPKEKEGRVEGRHALRLGAGVSMMFQRNYTPSNCDPNDTKYMSCQNWKTPVMAGFTLSGDIFPGAWMTRGWGGNVGLGFSYSHYFGANWKVKRKDDTFLEGSATCQTAVVDLRVRFPFHPHDFMLPVLLLKFGYRLQAFHMNDGNLTREQGGSLIPDVTFHSLDAGLIFDMIFNKWIALQSYFDFFPVLSRGEITHADEYGKAGGHGLAPGGALHGKFHKWIGWRLEIEYAYYWLSFTHETDTGAAPLRYAGSARDSYLSGLLSITFVN